VTVAKKEKAKTIGLCAFCPKVAILTGEHIWSEWMGKLFNQKEYLIIQRDKDRKIIKTWKRKKLDKKIPVVCQNCNNEWMSQLESNAKTAMKDMALHTAPKTLTSQELESIAIFAFKHMVITDHGAQRPDGSKRNPFFTTSTRMKFAASLTIPSGVQMWIAAFDRHFGVLDTRYYIFPSLAEAVFEVYAFTFGVGHLVIQAIACRIINPLMLGMPVPVGFADERWHSLASPFWPLGTKPVCWPPVKLLTTRKIDEFCQQWGVANIIERLQ
jgi:hypothetical protein